jgi:hypothetical protein
MTPCCGWAVCDFEAVIVLEDKRAGGFAPRFTPLCEKHLQDVRNVINFDDVCCPLALRSIGEYWALVAEQELGPSQR